MSLRRFAPLALTLALAASCLEGSPTPTVGASCGSDEDCGDLTCQYGRCRSQCSFDRDCPEGAACVPGDDGDGWVCTLSDEGGEGESSCPGALVPSIDGVCRRPCTVDAECGGAGRLCARAVCVDLIGECTDGEDNDGDGWIDVEDPWCWYLGEEEPATAPSECNDGLDNDDDGLTDASDPDCVSSVVYLESPLDPTCSDGEDNDLDGWTDLLDLECVIGLAEELGVAVGYECNDGLDNDGNGVADAEDPRCVHSWAAAESPLVADADGTCSNGLDDNFDGWVDWDDADCSFDGSETLAALNWPIECDDWVDNDGDGLVDFGDPDCSSGNDPYEAF